MMTYREAKEIARDTSRHAPTTYDLAERILRDAKRNRLADICAERAKLERTTRQDEIAATIVARYVNPD